MWLWFKDLKMTDRRKYYVSHFVDAIPITSLKVQSNSKIISIICHLCKLDFFFFAIFHNYGNCMKSTGITTSAENINVNIVWFNQAVNRTKWPLVMTILLFIILTLYNIYNTKASMIWLSLGEDCGHGK